MKMKRESYGYEASASAIRAAFETGISPGKVSEYKKELFGLFGIHGGKSYTKLVKKLHQVSAAERLCNMIYEREDAEEFFRFTLAFLGNKSCWAWDYETDENCRQLDPERLQVLDYEVKTLTLPEAKQVSYIEIGGRKSSENIRGDFKWAKNLRMIEDIADRGIGKLKLLLVCRNKHTALLACEYISRLCIHKSSMDFITNNKLYIVHSNHIDRSIRKESLSEPGIYGALDVQSMQPLGESFLNCDTLVVILIDRLSSLSANFTEKLRSIGKTHSNIIIIYEQEYQERPQGVMPFAMGADLGEIVANIDFDLGYDTYFIEEPSDEYLKKLMHDAAATYGYEISAEVNINDILKQLRQLRGKDWNINSTIISLIKKVAASKKKDSRIMEPKDFSLLETSAKIAKNEKIDKPQDSQTARPKSTDIYGLDDIKEAIEETIKFMKIRAEREKAGLKAPEKGYTYVFSGPSGVGKTMMAEYFVERLFENNLLPGKRFLSINAAQLKGRYVGQSIPKVIKAFEENDAIFLDECYSLTADMNGGIDSFSQEVLAQLCIELEKHGNKKLVIFAGYGGDIDEGQNRIKMFLEANPGIGSRINEYWNFPPYSPVKELPEIFHKMASSSDYDLEDGWRDIAISFFTKRKNSLSYGNGREARRLFQHSMTVQAARLMDKNPGIDALRLISCDDISRAADRILEGEGSIQGRHRLAIGF